MPTTVTARIASHQKVIHPLTPTDDVTLRATDPLLDAPISGFVPSRPPQKQALPFNSPPPGQLHSPVARPIPTPPPRSIFPSPIFLPALIPLIFLFSPFHSTAGGDILVNYFMLSTALGGS